jgi:hypothetical protein
MSAPLRTAMTALDRTLRIDTDQALNVNSLPSIGDFTITSSTTGALVVQSVTIFGRSIYIGVNVRMQGLITVNYTGTAIKNLAGESMATIINQTAINNSGGSDVTTPYPIGGTIAGAAILIYFSEVLNTANVPASGAFAVAVGTVAASLSGQTIYGNVLSMVSSPLGEAGEDVTFSYTPLGVNDLQDYAALKVSPIVAMLLTNLSAANGYYSNQTDLESFYGTDNIRKWSQMDGGTIADQTRIALYLSHGDSWINRKLREAGYTTPVATSSLDFDQLNEVCTEIVGAWVYMARGTMDVLDKSQKALRDQMQGHEKAARSQLRDLIMRGLDAPKAAFSTQFAAVAPAEYPSLGCSGSFTWPYNR